MNSSSPFTPASLSGSAETAPETLHATRPLYWSVRRELWENRSIYLAPLAVGALALFGMLISALQLPAKLREAAIHPGSEQALIEKPYDVAALLIMGTTFIVAIFYCLDALQGERRDRSMLFWKSLPVSDVITVLSKAIVPLLIIPVITFVVTIVVYCLMFVISTIVLTVSGMGVTRVWSQLPLFPMSLGLLFHLMVVHGLYYAPIYGWLLLASAWSRRAAFLWAGLPLLAIGLLERIAFNTSHFAEMLGSRLSGGGSNGAFPMTGNPDHLLGHLSPLEFFTSGGLWFGFVITAFFLAGAVRLRRNREPA